MLTIFLLIQGLIGAFIAVNNNNPVPPANSGKYI